MLINNKKLIERAEIIREKGTNRSNFFRGQVDKYTWVDFGSSYLMSDLSAAFLFGQLEQRKLIQEKRRTIWKHYFSHLNEWTKDDKDRNVLYKKNGDERYPDFKLYKMIARTVHKHTPQAQLQGHFFDRF